jgi:hypothetical protein
MLVAARTPLTVQELASFASVPSEEDARSFIEETARAFLSRRDDPAGPARYAVRHQSMRDLLNGAVPAGRPDLRSLADMFVAQVRLSHRDIVAALIPPGAAGERDWDSSNPYCRQHLAAHAAALGVLDTLVLDPGFLLTAGPGTVLAERGNLHTLDGKRAFAAYELSLHGLQSSTDTHRVDILAANAARTRAAQLVTECAKLTPSEWPIRWAAWSGHGHRTLKGHDGIVWGVAIGRAGDRDVIVSGGEDDTVRVWDAVTGAPTGDPLISHGGGQWRDVPAVAIGRAGDRDVIVSASDDDTVRVWDAVIGDPVRGPLTGHRGQVRGVAIGLAGDRHVIVSGSIDATVRVWDAVTGDPIGDPLAGSTGIVVPVAIGRAGDRDVIVSGGDRGALRVWDAVTGDPIWGQPTGRWGEVYGVAIGRAGAGT